LVEFRSGTRRVANEKKKIEDRRRIAVKPKATDDYVGRPNNRQRSAETAAESRHDSEYTQHAQTYVHS